MPLTIKSQQQTRSTFVDRLYQMQQNYQKATTDPEKVSQFLQHFRKKNTYDWKITTCH